MKWTKSFAEDRIFVLGFKIPAKFPLEDKKKNDRSDSR